MFFDDDNLNVGEQHYFANNVSDILSLYQKHPTVFNNVADNRAFPKYEYASDFISGYNNGWPLQYSNDLIRFNRFKPRDYTGLQIYIRCLYKFFKEATLYAPISPHNFSMVSCPDLSSPSRAGNFGTAIVTRCEQDRYISPAFYKNIDSNNYNDIKDIDLKDIVIANFKKEQVKCFQRAYSTGVNIQFYNTRTNKVLGSKYVSNVSDRNKTSTSGLYSCTVNIDNFDIDEFYSYTRSLGCHICCFIFTKKFYFATPLLGKPIVYIEKPERQMSNTTEPYYAHDAHTLLPVEIASNGMSCELLWEQCNGWDKLFTNGSLDIAKFLEASKHTSYLYFAGDGQHLYTGNAGYYASMSSHTSITFVDLTKGAIPLSFI